MANSNPINSYIFCPVVLWKRDIRSWMAVRGYDIWCYDLLLGVWRIRFMVSGCYSFRIIHSNCNSAGMAYGVHRGGDIASETGLIGTCDVKYFLNFKKNKKVVDITFERVYSQIIESACSIIFSI